MRWAASRFSSDSPGVSWRALATGFSSSASCSKGRRDSSPISTPAKVTAKASRLRRLPSQSGHGLPIMYWLTRFFISALWEWVKVCST
jgi:hypothetical protein